ncbi:hypothetical protein PYCC9005_004751 [Savitreella phatthalungensis]
MYRLQDQVRDLAVDYAPQKRPRALCEFDGTHWHPIEIVDETQLNQLQPTLKRLSLFAGNGVNGLGQQPLPQDSAYASTAGSTGHRSPSASVDIKYEPEPMMPRVSQQSQQSSSRSFTDAQQHVAESFRRSSSFRLPVLDLDQFEQEQEYAAGNAYGANSAAHSAGIQEESYDDYQESLPEEERDIVQDILVEQHAHSAQYQEPQSTELRRPSVLASPSYQRNLINFQDLAISEVDISEESADCDLAVSRQHIISAFPKQFEAEVKSPKPLTSFSVYSRAEDYVEMLHVVLVLESRKTLWKNMGSTNKPLDRVTSLPYAWAAEVDLPPLSLEEPRVVNEVECVIGGRQCFSVIVCDNHNDECRKCKGLASEDDCFACDGTGIFKKKPCVMCTGNGKYYCKACDNKAKAPCRNCGSANSPAPILRQAFVQVARETVVSQTMEVSSDNKALLILDARKLARQTIEAEKFDEGTLPVAACGVVIRNRGHIICATDIKSGARGLFEVVDGIDRVTFKGQLAPVVAPTQGQNGSRPGSIRSQSSQRSGLSRAGSWFKRGGNKEKDEPAATQAGSQSQAPPPRDDSDAGSVHSTASKRRFFKLGRK